MRPRGLTLVELTITMALLSLFLLISARVVSQYFAAYKGMEKALPASKSLAHQLEFLTRELSKAESIAEPAFPKLAEGFRPSWEENGKPLRVVSSDGQGKRVHLALGYSPVERALILVAHEETKGETTIPSHKMTLGASGGLWLKSSTIGRQNLLTLRLEPLSPGGEPFQTSMSLKGVVTLP